jgi:hypothetical protein
MQQRTEKKKLNKGETSHMTPEKVQLLESIGFKWADPTGQELWDERFSELANFKRKVGMEVLSVISCLSFGWFFVIIILHSLFIPQEGHCNFPTRSKDNLGKFLYDYAFLLIR